MPCQYNRRRKPIRILQGRFFVEHTCLQEGYCRSANLYTNPNLPLSSLPLKHRGTYNTNLLKDLLQFQLAVDLFLVPSYNWKNKNNKNFFKTKFNMQNSFRFCFLFLIECLNFFKLFFQIDLFSFLNGLLAEAQMIFNDITDGLRISSWTRPATINIIR